MSLDVFDQSPAQVKRRTPRGSRLAVTLAVVAVIAGTAYIASQRVVDRREFGGAGTGEVIVQIDPGNSLRTIGSTLAAAGVVRSSDEFVSAAQANPKASSIGPGTYRMQLGMGAPEAVALLLDPAARDGVKVVVPEGSRLTDIVKSVSSATGLQPERVSAAIDRASALGLPRYANGSAEGFLFPATYQFDRGVTADQVVATMLERFNRAAQEVDLLARAKAAGRDPYDVVVVASLVQAEVLSRDFGKAARTIENRLADGIRLQLDSTVNFGLGTDDLRLSAEQLASDTPYNTYRIDGLPPTPIGSPGQAALEAALDPPKGDWLYFVTTDPSKGTTKFTGDYKQFLRWKAQFQASG